jgi:hypothetical protein
LDENKSSIIYTYMYREIQVLVIYSSHAGSLCTSDSHRRHTLGFRVYAFDFHKHGKANLSFLLGVAALTDYRNPARGNELSILSSSPRLILLPPLHNGKLGATSARVLSMGVSFWPDHETDDKITRCLQVLFGNETNLQIPSMCNF